MTTETEKIGGAEQLYGEKDVKDISPPSTLHDGAEPAPAVVETEKAAGLAHPDEEPIYLVGSQLAFVIFALCLVVFCVALDNTIIATAVRLPSHNLHK